MLINYIGSEQLVPLTVNQLKRQNCVSGVLISSHLIIQRNTIYFFRMYAEFFHLDGCESGKYLPPLQWVLMNN